MIRDCELPESMVGENGRLATFLPHLDTSKGQIHLLLPSGIGDTAWVVAKYWALARERDVTFHTPECGDFKRVQPYFDLMGLWHEYISGLDIRELLSYPGEFEPDDFNEGGVFYVHANKHIEAGHPLHKGAPKYGKPSTKEWHPWLPFKNPAVPRSELDATIRLPKPYVLVHAASATYCEGNYFPRLWGEIVRRIEREVAPVVMIGAAWDEPMIAGIEKWYKPKHRPVIQQSLARALYAVANAAAMVGVDSGLSIFAAYYGVPALRCYPRWLKDMPGTFEDLNTLHPHDKPTFMDMLLDDLPDWLNGL